MTRLDLRIINQHIQTPIRDIGDQPSQILDIIVFRHVRRKGVDTVIGQMLAWLVRQQDRKYNIPFCRALGVGNPIACWKEFWGEDVTFILEFERQRVSDSAFTASEVL